MSAELVAAFWLVSFLFVITPGADWAYAISAGLRGRVLAAVAGLLSGHLLATVVVAAGVGAILAALPLALTALTLAGAAYLVWLGIGLQRRPASIAAADGRGVGSSWHWFARGAGISGLNPKVFLLFLALLPQFTSEASALPVPAQIVVLGLVHTASCAIVYSIVGAGARTVLASRPRAARIVTRISGIAMILIGVALVVEEIASLVINPEG